MLNRIMSILSTTSKIEQRYLLEELILDLEYIARENHIDLYNTIPSSEIFGDIDAVSKQDYSKLNRVYAWCLVMSEELRKDKWNLLV